MICECTRHVYFVMIGTDAKTSMQLEKTIALFARKIWVLVPLLNLLPGHETSLF